MDAQLNWEHDRRLLITCSGEFGWEEHDRLPDRLDDTLGIKRQPEVLFDMQQVLRVNSAGVGTLFQIGKLVRKREGRLILANVPPAVREIFKVVGLDQVIDIAANLEEARAVLESSP